MPITMVRLRTRLDQDTRIVHWALDTDVEAREFNRLSDLLDHHNLKFDHDDSCVVVKVVRGALTHAKLNHSVTYNLNNDTITLCGLLGTYTGSPFDTFLRFGNQYLELARRYGGHAHFYKYYAAINTGTSLSSDDDVLG